LLQSLLLHASAAAVVFQPSTCSGPCNDELSAFIEASTRWQYGLTVEIPPGIIPLGLDGAIRIGRSDPQAIELRCAPGAILAVADPTPSVYTAGTVSGAVGDSILTGTGTAWCGADGACGTVDDELASGDLLWTDPDEVYLVSLVRSPTSLRLGRPLTAAVNGAYTASRGAVLRIERAGVRITGECTIRCEGGCAHELGTGPRTIPVSVLTGSYGADLRGVRLLNWDHPDDVGSVSACRTEDRESCSLGAAHLGGSCWPTFSAREGRYLRTGEDSGDVDNPANNGDGACFATVAGGTRIEIGQGAVGYAPRQVLIGDYSSSTAVHGSGEDSPWIEAPLGCSGCLALSQSQEQAYDCYQRIPGGDCEPDMEPWIDIGDSPRVGENNWIVDVPLWFGDAVTFLRAGTTAQVQLRAHLLVLGANRTILAGSGLVLGTITASQGALDPAARFHGTFCSGGICEDWPRVRDCALDGKRIDSLGRRYTFKFEGECQ
jgi:hypothetical protein